MAQQQRQGYQGAAPRQQGYTTYAGAMPYAELARGVNPGASQATPYYQQSGQGVNFGEYQPLVDRYQQWKGMNSEQQNLAQRMGHGWTDKDMTELMGALRPDDRTQQLTRSAMADQDQAWGRVQLSTNPSQVGQRFAQEYADRKGPNRQAGNIAMPEGDQLGNIFRQYEFAGAQAAPELLEFADRSDAISNMLGIGNRSVPFFSADAMGSGTGFAEGAGYDPSAVNYNDPAGPYLGSGSPWTDSQMGRGSGTPFHNNTLASAEAGITDWTKAQKMPGVQDWTKPHAQADTGLSTWGPGQHPWLGAYGESQGKGGLPEPSPVPKGPPGPIGQLIGDYIAPQDQPWQQSYGPRPPGGGMYNTVYQDPMTQQMDGGLGSASDTMGSAAFDAFDFMQRGGQSPFAGEGNRSPEAKAKYEAWQKQMAGINKDVGVSQALANAGFGDLLTNAQQRDIQAQRFSLNMPQFDAPMAIAPSPGAYSRWQTDPLTAGQVHGTMYADQFSQDPRVQDALLLGRGMRKQTPIPRADTQIDFGRDELPPLVASKRRKK